MPINSGRLQRATIGDGAVLYIETLDLGEHAAVPDASDDQEISSSATKRLEPVFEVLTAFAANLAETVKTFQSDKVIVEFGCEVAVESGSLIAVLGKASGTSSMNVTLEWNR